MIYGVLCSAWMMEACGPARPMALPVKECNSDSNREGSAGETTGLLNLKIVSKDTERSAPRVVPVLAETFAANEKQIVYGQPFPNRGLGLYFVWPQEFLDSLILHGWVTYRIWSATNQWTSDVITVPIRFDISRKEWFVSVFDLVSLRHSEVPPNPSAETQVFILELGLANHTNRAIEIKFRIQGAPSVGVQR